ncbi:MULTISPECIES: Gar1/Naf1 family protein [unclassified Thermoplasma]|uniref:Gar1/Naf1 family protein n=1 Tax=unclassified Thermoplasma TaxID=2684908 RepID=UPI000D9605C1|nr:MULTISPECIES: H/ACA ribonucleoprotein complex subunit GAR1 [unclassified Thermoplasma]PYB68001.1 H/ACA RNA-protein complex protein Gar1 [Thermoplasma sp. Kam2015]
MHAYKVTNIRGRDMVIQLDKPLDLKTKIYDASGKKIGVLVKIMGPVDEPYGLVSLDSQGVQTDVVYVN